MLNIDKNRYKAGQVIKICSTWSSISPVPIWHYGVVVGYDDVVHFNLDADICDIRIIRTDLKKFVGLGWGLRVCQMSEMNKNLDECTIIARAISSVGSDFGGYDLFKNNCEHFANWCVSGTKYCNQVPWSEGDEHSAGIKMLEKAVAEPLFHTLDNITYGLERAVDGLDDILDKLPAPPFW